MYLNTHSWYSLRYGVLSIEKLLEGAVERGVTALALTDINNTTGMWEFIRACRSLPVHPLVGVEFRNGSKLVYLGIARNNYGVRELHEFLSGHLSSGNAFPRVAPPFENVFVIYPFGELDTLSLRENEFIGVSPRRVSQLRLHAYRFVQSKLVICQPVTFLSPESHELHRHLRAIHENCLLTQLTTDGVAAREEIMLPQTELLEAYKDFPLIIKNTEKLISSCHIDFDFSLSKNKKNFTGNPADDRKLLEKLALDGLQYRYGRLNREAAARVRHELDIIDKLDFASYFLLTWDTVRYSMSRGFYHVGRGSGANSVVAYCLRITDVDPIELDLYFERFLNPKRTSPPDFDIDYSWKERDHVLEYLFKRYGERHVALLGTMTTFKGRSIFRELGKVYGLPKDEIDALVDHPEKFRSHPRIAHMIFHYGKQLEDFPNLRSIHAGGVLISEEPIYCYTALDMPPKGMPTSQWDMYTAEEIGFEKLDILSQRGIGHIRECVDIVRYNQGIKIDAYEVGTFKRDEHVKRQLESGNTIGCFYIESPAMRGLLKKLHCNNYLHLVAASSIIRPGVAQSGMMREYIYRFHHPDKFSYLHPIMKEQLAETFGVMVYQEDVIKICHHFAGLDLSDADVLRRAMSGKYRSKKELERIVERFHSGCREKGYPEELIREVWRQVESFAGYSFSKAHSASFAVESYQSLYLKAHFPLEFMVAVINNFGGFYQTWVYVTEAKKNGATIHLPCVNEGSYLTAITSTDIYLGFVHVQHLETQLGQQIEEERILNGSYRSLENFAHRLQPALEQLLVLIRIGAFRFTGRAKKELLWEAHMLLSGKVHLPPPAALLQAPARTFVLPRLAHSVLEDAYDELELLGFPVTLSYFDLLKTSFRGELPARELLQHVGHRVRVAGMLVTTKYVRTKRGDIMHFATFLDPHNDFFDTVHFPQSLKAWPFQGSGVYLILGKVVEEFGFPSIEVEKMARLPFQEDPRY